LDRILEISWVKVKASELSGSSSGVGESRGLGFVVVGKSGCVWRDVVGLELDR